MAPIRMKTSSALSLAAASLIAANGHAQEKLIPPEALTAHGDLEVTVWATSPMIFNPTNIDVDKDGRLWVAEGVNYRGHYNRKPEGDRIMVLEDTDGDGKADKSWAFVQEPFLRAPMGIAVLDNKIVVSMTPSLIVYTDNDRDLKYDPAFDSREVILTGFNGRVHDHSLHSVTFGPDGQWYWNAGNCGALFTDKSGTTYRIGSDYDPYYGRSEPGDLGWSPREIAGKPSDDGFVYLGGFAARMNPDGSNVHIIGHNFRNSYEQTVTSFGDVFQNDNDDPPAARTAFLMEYGNAGFNSFDGQRGWGADRRPGQDTPTAQWRQEDPGTMPAGDVYGGGAPTGIAYYENGALGEDYRGMLLSCEPARNTVFGYFPKPDGAGFRLERFDFLTSNKEGEFAGADFRGGRVSEDLKTHFRPSDVVVGADGAIYVSDWFDARVGGHADHDETLSGTIYRIAPKGFQSKPATFDTTTVEGQIAALKSPAVNVRSLGFNGLVERGEAAVPAVKSLLNSDNKYFQARAVWVLSKLGERGLKEVERLLKHDDPQLRTVAYRAVRRENHDFWKHSKRMAEDESPAVRREVALAMRDHQTRDAEAILVDIARQYDGDDRWYLEAFGTGASKQEADVFARVARRMADSDPTAWSDAFADIAWRLHPEQAVPALTARALAGVLPVEARKAAVTALAYVGSERAVNAIVDIAAQTGGPVQGDAMWWLLNRKDGVWKDFDLNRTLRDRGLFDPDTVEIAEIQVPEAIPTKLTVAEIEVLSGDVQRGKALTTACLTCHKIDGQGVEFGPDITRFARSQTTDVLIRSIIDPSAEISHGFNGTELKTKSGEVVHGVLLSGGNPTVISSQGGVVQMIPRDRIESRNGLNRSLMLSAEQMGFGAQEVADVVAYLKTIK